ncbi:hypothetical protein [uncultured Hymenobacter sp.]|uniref:hypothetical protein n=1 Tax=uncultured Hymenobacter sp. TaxID=170016 RepID=UPI0035CC073F
MAAVAASSSSSVSSAPRWARLWPHLLAILFFALLAAVYFAPIVFEGQSLAQHDITQFQGGAREVQQWAATHNGHEPLWTNSMFSGMPTYLISAHFSGDWSLYLHKLFTLGLPAVVANLFLALVCGYALLVAVGLRPLVAVAGAVALGFSSYNLIILAAGHNTKSLALAYAPLVLGGLLVTFRRDKWLGAALFTLGLAMNIRSNHPQITYYLGLLIVIFGVIELVAAVRAGRLADFGGRVGLLGLGAAIAVGVSFGRLYTTYEYSKLSNRAKSELSAAPAGPGTTTEAANRDRDYAFGWSYGVGETITLLVPNFFGGASQMALGPDSNLAKAGLPAEYLGNLPTYWGAQPSTSGPVYVGAVVCFLFVLGLFVVDKRTRYWLLAGTILSLLLAWGKNFGTLNNLVFELLPGYNKFRAVSMALVIAQLAMPLLAALALGRVLRPEAAPALPPLAPATPAGAAPHPALAKAMAAAAGKIPTPPGAVNEAYARLRPVLWAGAITAGGCALAWLASFSFDFQGAVDAQLTQSGFTPDLLRALRADRAELLRNDVWRALLFIGLALGVLYFHLKGRLAARPAAALIAALVLLDLWGVDKRYLGADNFQPQSIAASFQPSPADEEILKDKDLSYRVLSLKGDPFADATTSYYHKSIGGYHGAKLRRYQELIERQITPQLQQIFTQNKLDAAPVLNMLNTRYLLIPENAQAKQPEQAARNPGALGNAWFVSQVRAVPSPDQEMAALSTLNPATEAVVDISKFPTQKAATYDPAGSSIALTEYAPDRLTYRGSAAQPGLVVFSEIYYADGWQAYLNGQPVPHLRANYVLRALPVPAGPLSIEFRFEPKAYALGNAVSLASSVALLLVLLGAGAYWLRRRPATEQPPELAV